MIGKRLLVVEDEFVIALDLQNLLEAAGHEVVGLAANIPDALSMIETTTIDGAILDINLRGTFVCMKHEIAQMMRQGGGVVVNTSSGAGIRGPAGLRPGLVRVDEREVRVVMGGRVVDPLKIGVADER